MVQTPFRRTATSLALATIVLGSAAETAIAGERSVSIRIYDTTAREATTREAAIAVTSGILAQAGVAIDWRNCGVKASRCEEPRRKGEMILRLVPTRGPGHYPASGTIATRRTVNDAGLSLAFAVVEPRTRVGVLATVFLDRVQLVAERAGVGLSTLLGRTIAHEIGHLLLGTMGHSRDGLMREVWTDDELVQGEPDDWLFSASDRGKMLSGLRRIH